MALKKAARAFQHMVSAEFVFNDNDTIADINGAVKNFGRSDLALAFDAINLPPGSRIVGGEWVTETAFDAATYTITVGDSAVANRYLAGTDVKGAARTPLVPTGFRNDSGLNLRVGITAADVTTAGKATLRVEYVIDGKADGVQPS